MPRYQTAFTQWLCAADFAVGLTCEVAIIEDAQRSETKELLNTLWKTFRPRQVTAIFNYPPESDASALLKDRPLLKDLPTAYLKSLVSH